MRSILQMGVSLFSQLDWNMISTMFLLVSSGPSSDTVDFDTQRKRLRNRQQCAFIWVTGNGE